MKIVICILILLFSTVSYGQFPCPLDQIGKKDTVPYSFSTAQPLYNYYNANNSLAWANVKEYNANLIPIGGSYNISYTKPNTVKGYIIYVTKAECKMERIGYLDANKKTISKTLVVMKEDSIL